MEALVDTPCVVAKANRGVDDAAGEVVGTGVDVAIECADDGLAVDWEAALPSTEVTVLAAMLPLVVTDEPEAAEKKEKKQAFQPLVS